MKITHYELWRLELPTGRVIGDANCRYDSLDCAALCLKGEGGLSGWGYGATCSKGVFTRPAFYIQPMPSRTALRAEFERTWAPIVLHTSLDAALAARKSDPSTHTYLNDAVRTALWDLTAQAADQPMHRMLGGESSRDRVPAYGSLLDFPLSEADATQRARRFVDRGFKAIKVKVGCADVERDIRRLQAIRQAVGPDVELTADANTMWTWRQTVERIAAYESAGIRLRYIEDPLPYDDIDGYAHLARELPVDVAGHDYAPTPGDLRKLLDVGGIQRIRLKDDFDDATQCARLAREYDVSLIGGNTLFEIGVHAACALVQTERIEFSDLAWNLLMREPVRFEDGQAIAPQRPGHGLHPRTDRLNEFSKPEP